MYKLQCIASDQFPKVRGSYACRAQRLTTKKKEGNHHNHSDSQMLRIRAGESSQTLSADHHMRRLSGDYQGIIKYILYYH